MQLHNMDGNSWYPIGEEVMFMGRLNRFTANRGSLEERLRVSEEWMQWNFAAARWVKSVHSDAVERLVFPLNPEKRAEKKMHWLQNSFVGSLEEVNLPMFGRKSE